MDLRNIVSVLRGAWWLLLLGLVIGGAAAAGISLRQTPEYTSMTELFISTTDSTSTQAVFTGSQFSQDRVASYARLLQGQELASRVIKQLHLSTTADALAGQVSVQPVADTVLVDVSVTDPSPQRAQQIATAIGQQFPRLVAELETPAAGGGSLVKVTVVQPPTVPTSPSSPQTTRNVAAGALAGLLVGLSAAIARARLDRTIKDPELMSELTDAPVIGVILRDPVLSQSHVFEDGASSPAAEGYRRLRANLQFLHVDQPPKVIMVTSAIPGEGKTTTAINLALALVEVGNQVALMDGDLRRPRVTRYLQLVGGVGLTNVLSGSAELPDVLQRYGGDELSVIGAGPTPPNPSQLLASSQMRSLIDDLASKHDYVIIDSPPVLPVADATSLAVMADGVVLSVRYGSTRKELVRRTAATLEHVGARILGVVMNIVPASAEVSGGYGYKYDYGRTE